MDNAPGSCLCGDQECQVHYTFRSAITEMDSGRMGSKKESNSNPCMKEHQGRTLVFKGIVSKKWVAFALRTAMSRKGRGMGTETKDEVRTPLRDSLGAGTVIAADGAKTWQSIAKEIKKPILRGLSQACLGSVLACHILCVDCCREACRPSDHREP